MGSFASKIFYSRDDRNLSGKVEEKNVSTPGKYTITPPMRRKLSVDPRSASAGITRTPIDVTPTPQKCSNRTASAIPRRLQVKPYLETNFDETFPVLVVEDPLDPRSPNISQPRTPIILPQSTADSEVVEIPEQAFNSKSYCQDPRSPSVGFDRTPIFRPKSPQKSHITESQLAFCETTSSENLPEIQALPDIIHNLQTLRRNFAESFNEINDEDNDCEEICASEMNKENVDPNPSPATEKEVARLSTQQLVDNVLLTAVRRIELETDEKIQIWQDFEDKHSQQDVNKDEVIIEVEENDETKKNTEVKITEKRSFGQETTMNRTPLGNRSNNHQNSNKKPLSIKPKNLSQAIAKNKSNILKAQQENTPPGKIAKSKLNASQWDPNNTVLI